MNIRNPFISRSTFYFHITLILHILLSNTLLETLQMQLYNSYFLFECTHCIYRISMYFSVMFQISWKWRTGRYFILLHRGNNN